MTPYEKFIKIMRQQCHEERLKFGEMTGKDTLKVGNMRLDKDFYVVAEGLELKKGETVVVSRITDELYVILCKVVI